MKRSSQLKTALLSLGLAAVTSLGFISVATAASAPLMPSVTTSTTTTTTTAGTTCKNSPAELAKIKSMGVKEIERRLASLDSLSIKITSSTKLTAADQTTLQSNVQSEISGLTSLEATLNGETSSCQAKTDAQNIISGYRVYALELPQVNIVKTADGQQAAETKLNTLETELATKLSGSTNSTLTSALSDMQAKLTAASSISSSLESSVITLQPTDYNTNHSVLGGDVTQLKTAQSDIQTAISDAKTIISGLKLS